MLKEVSPREEREGNEPLTLGAYGPLLTARERAGSIRYARVQAVIGDSIAPYEQEVLANIKARETDIRTSFQVHSNVVKIMTGQKPSRALATSLLVEKNICAAMDNRAEAELRAGRHSSFALWFDASAGARAVLAGIPLREAEAHGQREGVSKLAKNVTHEHTLGRGDPTTQVEEKLIFKAQAHRASELLQQDPTGFFLVDEAVEKIREEVAQPSGTPSGMWVATAEIYLTGAELAQHVYKAIYPLSEERTEPS
jgi:hypothetical protein